MPAQREPAGPAQGWRRQLLVLFLSAAIFAAWVWGLHWLFARATSQSYFRWYVENGTLISITTAFLALVWQGLEEQKGLLSWHPARFLASCMTLAGVFYQALAVNLAGPLDGTKQRADDAVSIIEALWDSVFAILMDVLMAVAVLAWLVVMAPPFYLLTLVTGAPARREIRDTGRRLVVSEDALHTTITDQPSSLPVPPGAVDVSLGVRPFALTNALNAAVLFLAKLLLPAAG